MPVIAGGRLGGWRPALVVCGIALVLGGLGTTQAAGQSETTSFEATASAEGVRIGVVTPGFVIADQIVDVGIPVAQSTVDGLGTSKAFASDPYPGQLVISGPGFFAGATGLPNPGEYPLYVASSYPTVQQKTYSQPNYELSAKSAEQSSEAAASAGGSAAESSIAAVNATAASKRDASSGSVSAEAVSTADVVNLAGGALRIGAVRATAKVTRTAGAEPARSSSLAVDGVSVAGQAVGFNDKGLLLAGSNTPIPEDNPLAAVLQQAKISVQYLQPISTPDGVVSAGVVITQQQQVPQGPNATISYVFGRAVAHASAISGAAAAGPGPPDLGGETAGIGSESAVAGVGGSPLAGGALSTGASGVTVGGPGSSPSAGPRALDRTGTRITRAGASKGGASTASIYLILIIGSVIALAGGQALRIMGVRMAWTS